MKTLAQLQRKIKIFVNTITICYSFTETVLGSLRNTNSISIQESGIKWI